MNLPDSWPLRLLGRLYVQFAGTQWAPMLANAIGAEADQLQAAGVAMLFLWSIDPITDDPTSAAYGVGRGAQLDRIGRLVGQPRSGATDDQYRYYLRARIAANRSDGTTDKIIAVFKAMLGATELPLYAPGGNASYTLTLITPIADDVAEIALYFLRYATMAGVRAILETQAFPDAEMFFTAQACYTTGAISIGDATIDVDDASDFPTSGTIILESGTPDEETLAFSSRSNTVLYLGTTTANAHDPGASVSLVGSEGEGFPVATYVNGAGAPGDPSISVVSEAGFAAGDEVIIDQGLANEETLTVTSTAAGQIFVSPDLAFSHTDGAAVVLASSGGSLERAHQA